MAPNAPMKTTRYLYCVNKNDVAPEKQKAKNSNQYTTIAFTIFGKCQNFNSSYTLQQQSSVPYFLEHTIHCSKAKIQTLELTEKHIMTSGFKSNGSLQCHISC